MSEKLPVTCTESPGGATHASSYDCVLVHPYIICHYVIVIHAPMLRQTVKSYNLNFSISINGAKLHVKYQYHLWFHCISMKVPWDIQYVGHKEKQCPVQEGYILFNPNTSVASSVPVLPTPFSTTFSTPCPPVSDSDRYLAFGYKWMYHMFYKTLIHWYTVNFDSF